MPQVTVPAAYVPLAEATRGGVVESVHAGAVAVVDRKGRVLHAAGDPYTLTFTRSALKPLQALPFAAGDGVARFGYSAAQVALMCASHSGEPRHVEAVADMLARAGCSAADLQCGTHAPGFYEARGEVPSLIDPPPGCPFAARCPHVMQVCREIMPGPESVGPEHWVRCHLYGPGATLPVQPSLNGA